MESEERSSAAEFFEPSDRQASRRVLTHAILWTLATIGLFLLAEALLFRLHWYYKYLEPASSAGVVELRLHWLRRLPPASEREIAVVGDSRIAEGFSERDATELGQPDRMYFWNIGMAGSSPRVWFYFLRDADPRHNRFRAIVLALDHYDDEDSYDSSEDRLIDLSFVIGRLRLSDAWDFAASMKNPASSHTALVGALLKGTVLRRDVQEFLNDIPKRLSETNDFRKNGLDYNGDYGGEREDVRGISVDWRQRKLFCPAGLSRDRRRSIEYALVPNVPPQHTGALTRYRMQWFGRIMQLYRGSSTRIVFLELPRGPLPQPPRTTPRVFIDWARQQPNVTVLDPATFRDLETPETFFDGYHLNRKGRTIFTPRLEARVRDILLNR